MTLFKFCETYFLSATKEFVTRIDVNLLAEMMLKDPMVLSQFGTIFRSCDTEITKEVGMNLLEEMLIFYFRLRSFSYAKQQQQKNKIECNLIYFFTFNTFCRCEKCLKIF